MKFHFIDISDTVRLLHIIIKISDCLLNNQS